MRATFFRSFKKKHVQLSSSNSRPSTYYYVFWLIILKNYFFDKTSHQLFDNHLTTKGYSIMYHNCTTRKLYYKLCTMKIPLIAVKAIFYCIKRPLIAITTIFWRRLCWCQDCVGNFSNCSWRLCWCQDCVSNCSNWTCKNKEYHLL